MCGNICGNCSDKTKTLLFLSFSVHLNLCRSIDYPVKRSNLIYKAAFVNFEWIYLHARSDGMLFNLTRLRAKTKVRDALVRDMLLADDAAVASHTQHELQTLGDRFSQTGKDIGLTISLKKTNVQAQNTGTASHHHRRLRTRRRPPVYVLRLHHHRQSLCSAADM